MIIRSLFLSILLSAFVNLVAQQTYQVGYGKSDITFVDDQLGLFGYGSYDHRIQEKSAMTSSLLCRVIHIKDAATAKSVFFLHADLGGIFEPLRIGLVKRIREELDPDFDDACLMMTASHTHCAPSGYSHYALYMTPTPGFHPELVDFTVDRMFDAFKQAYETTSPETIRIKEGWFEPDVPVAFNRALKAHNRNAEVEKNYKKTESHLAINRNMVLMDFRNEAGKPRGQLNWFGVHPIEMLPDHNYINAASKGYAAVFTEDELDEDVVAIFAQSSAGDVMTVDGHNPRRFSDRIHAILCDSSFDIQHSCIPHAVWNGSIQSRKALEITRSDSALDVSGGLDWELIYVDLSDVAVDPEFSHGWKNARTSSATMGASFISGEFTWRDINFRRYALKVSTDVIYLIHGLKRPFYSKERRLYQKQLNTSQGAKRIIIDGKEKSFANVKIAYYGTDGLNGFMLNVLAGQDLIVKEILRQQSLGALEEHTLLPEVLPVQIIRIGNIAIAGIPTEITTIAHNRLQRTLEDAYRPAGVERVFISSYANEYAGYTTTWEEYNEQRYEGGHTLFGMHQLGAFQTIFRKLATEMGKPKIDRALDRDTRAPVFSKEELDKRSHLKLLE